MKTKTKNNLKEIREEQNLTQGELAEKEFDLKEWERLKLVNVEVKKQSLDLTSW